jgi:predicted  nucleic acid-binding Zn-ribbon protein
MTSGVIVRNATLLKRIARVSGLIGVGIVFVANFMNDHFVAALQEDTQNVDAVQGEAAQAREASDAGLDQLEAAERISRLEVNLAGVTSRSSAEEAGSIIESFSLYFSTLESSVAMLNKSLQQIKDIPERGVTLNDETAQALQAASAEVAAIAEALSAGTKELAELKASLESAESAEQAEAMSQAIAERFQAFDALETQYREISTDINELFESIEQQVDAERQSSVEAADIVGGLVYVLSAIGGTIAGFGNWLGGKVAPSAVPETT